MKPNKKKQPKQSKHSKQENITCINCGEDMTEVQIKRGAMLVCKSDFCNEVEHKKFLDNPK